MQRIGQARLRSGCGYGRYGCGRLTLLEVVGFPHIDTDQRHQLELREALAGGLGQWQQIPQIGYLRIYEIASHLGGALRRLVRIESAREWENKRS